MVVYAAGAMAGKGKRAGAMESVDAFGKEPLEQVVGALLAKKFLTIACAESCTGGLLASRLTDVAGSSAYVMGAIVSYTNEVKSALLGVRETTLSSFGAVSEETACEMAEGIRRAVPADIGVAITGIAGPGGATREKPVGLVYVAVSYTGNILVRRNVFTGTRAEVKYQSTEKALAMIREVLL